MPAKIIGRILDLVVMHICCRLIVNPLKENLVLWCTTHSNGRRHCRDRCTRRLWCAGSCRVDLWCTRIVPCSLGKCSTKRSGKTSCGAIAKQQLEQLNDKQY